MKNILITGPPGAGKTNLVKKIIHRLKLLNTECGGFYTEEVRNDNNRIGFDVVTLNGERAILSRKNPPQDEIQRPFIGQYAVYVDDFEKIALPVFENVNKIVVIDEIGKMEMFSEKFQNNVKEVFENETVQVIATVPVKGDLSLVRQLKERRDCQLITVNYKNRESLVDEIMNSLNFN